MTNKNTKLPTKNFTDSYLYSVANYEKNLFNYLMTSEEVDKTNESFKDIIYEVKKRHISNALTKVLESNKIILLLPHAPVPKAFKVMCAKDVKGDKSLKIFIDVSDIMRKEDGKYRCTNIDVLISYLVSAMNSLIYYADPKRLIMNDKIIGSGAKCFALLFTHIIDYLYKVSSTGNIRDKCLYLASLYYVKNILKKDVNGSIKILCKRISGLSDREEEVLWIQLKENDLDNIKTFIEALARILRLPKLTIDIFIEKWIFLYGVGTQFALELYPAFSTMITNVYVGCYLNNQKTIEKIVGRELIEFTTTILKVGGECV